MISRMIGSSRKTSLTINGVHDGNYMQPSNITNATNGTGSDAIVYFDPTADPNIPTLNPVSMTVSGAGRPHRIGLGHELIHADRTMRGVLINPTILIDFYYRVDSTSYINGQRFRLEEYATIGLRDNKPDDVTENNLRKENGLDPRGAY